ncbi:hypothetical protein B0T26DRAFT_394031 [Lasiosphaeria miniovina]|uniref:Uncharacterized protein n=1 Tax=Lasiosphaeria miniovina TaxID=1954250 RepID=A0AA40A4E3_9PEZI|nr:uncharacterized protein B0T26DRAFT_394031 [Lasiosphaeria miniovina]KAK0709088.1 hypothetical protein B0T26DRAFT_394031 [Lasiosphaeria miniovina]
MPRPRQAFLAALQWMHGTAVPSIYPSLSGFFLAGTLDRSLAIGETAAQNTGSTSPLDLLVRSWCLAVDIPRCGVPDPIFVFSKLSVLSPVLPSVESKTMSLFHHRSPGSPTNHEHKKWFTHALKGVARAFSPHHHRRRHPHHYARLLTSSFSLADHAVVDWDGGMQRRNLSADSVSESHVSKYIPKDNAWHRRFRDGTHW